MTEAQTSFEEKVSRYAHPEVLVSTQWVADHLQDPRVVVAECDEDVLLYEVGHIPGAVKLDWHTDLQDPVERDFVDPQGFADLMGQKGVGPDTTVVLYGDRANWYATYTFWLFKLYGHRDVRVMDGGRAAWEREKRPWTREVAAIEPAQYPVPRGRDEAIRAYRDQVFEQVRRGAPMIDVRSPAEYSGELIHMLDYPQEGAQRGGHIPGATNIPWAKATSEDGTFLPAEDLRRLYAQTNSISPESEIITYCRIGERSSHTWFVLTQLLGYPHVRNYDGSWTEWGNLVDAPIEK